MNNPFDRATGPAIPVKPGMAPPITDGQRSYLRDIMLEKASLKSADMDDAVVKIDAWLDGLSRTEASTQIDVQRGLLDGLRQAARQAGRDDDLEGFWELGDGRIVKVQVAVHGSGNLYGKVLDPEHGTFDYTRGILSEVRTTGTRLTLERAKELGHLYGMCIRCGATLTDESSIANGIGPVCAAKWL